MGAARASVLVVDDDDDLREWISHELGRAGFAVESAANGNAAIEVASRRRFDVALIDLRLPGMNGIEILSALKQQDPELEAVMASGQGTISDAVASLKRGAYDFIEKPFTLRELVPILEKALQKSQLQGSIALHDASNALLEVRGETELVTQAISLVKRLLKVSVVGLVSRDGSAITTEPEPSNGFFALVEQLARGAGACEGTHLHGGPGCSHSLGPFASAMTIRLVLREKEHGAMVLLRDSSLPPFTDEEFRRSAVFGRQLALALDNARLHEELLARIDEVVRTRDALLSTERLALAGQLAASVAHEIKTPLSYVLWNLEYILDRSKALAGELQERARETGITPFRFAPSPQHLEQSLQELHEAAADAREGVLRIRNIAKDLSDLARPTDPDVRPVDLTTVLDWAVQVTAQDREMRARFDYRRVSGPLPPVLGSEEKLGQVFVNLLNNATQAIPLDAVASHRVTLAVSRAESSVVVEISDTGQGIPPASLERIFEPFFTTKPSGGTGLGLAISRGIVRAHGGDITVQSDEGKGATFRVTLPLKLS